MPKHINLSVYVVATFTHHSTFQREHIKFQMRKVLSFSTPFNNPLLLHLFSFVFQRSEQASFNQVKCYHLALCSLIPSIRCFTSVLYSFFSKKSTMSIVFYLENVLRSIILFTDPLCTLFIFIINLSRR